jgi:hypothetical protein
MDCFGCGDGGLAPLARAIQDALVGVGFEDFGLAGVGVEAEAGADEVDDSQFWCWCGRAESGGPVGVAEEGPRGVLGVLGLCRVFSGFPGFLAGFPRV